ncbi:PorT family protein [Hyunsoonleella flava]|uniref:PorT family protein n=1 Tax=Hyunsoonleella flava TaxID=2527939 RepID=A0A4Q9FE38_9FLAO|nr:porin family protein [Hyunsoonleella flava]TBN03915.1 PorT family protein [Hyunsoonleella flava]
MKKPLAILIFTFFTTAVFSQEITSKVVDSLYKEDQFYIGTTYNLLTRKPEDLKQNSFSLGFHLGYIKDMPINKRRNKSIGIGLGYSTNSYIQNMLIQQDNSGNLNYSIIDTEAISFTKNKFSEHVLELPIEYRWRTSTKTSYKFWRIYAGAKFGYVFSNRSKFKGSLGELKYNNIEDFNAFQYGLTLSVGYNTWNIYVYYGLNPIFSDTAQLDGENLDMNAVKIGLMFYIL